MNNTKKSGFLGFLKAVFAGFGAEQASERQVANERPSESKGSAVKKAPARRNDWKRTARSANVRRTFAEGQVLSATVKRVDQASAYFTIKGASSAVVSAKSCEKSGTVRFADLGVGQIVRVRVKAWYPQTRQIVLSGVEEIVCSDAKKAIVRKCVERAVKPAYETLPKGTVVLVDGANLLHEFEPAEAPKVLRSVVDGLKEQGYDARIYLEHRAWKFYSFNQGSEEAGKKFKALCRELDVTIVGWEADLAILQVLKTVPKSVGLTNDRYADYAKTFPDLVGTPRLCGFSVTKIDNLELISIDGLSKAVKVAERVEQKVWVLEEPVVQDSVVEEPVIERPQAVRTFSNDVKGGFCGYGNVLLAKGNVQGAIRCFEKGVARHQSEGYAGLAEICHSQGDVKTAAKFARLGEKLQRRLRDQELRKRRLWAERRRACCNRYALCA